MRLPKRPKSRTRIRFCCLEIRTSGMLTEQEVNEYKSAQDKEKKLNEIAEDLSEEELLALLEKKKSQKK